MKLLLQVGARHGLLVITAMSEASLQRNLKPSELLKLVEGAHTLAVVREAGGGGELEPASRQSVHLVLDHVLRAVVYVVALREAYRMTSSLTSLPLQRFE